MRWSLTCDSLLNVFTNSRFNPQKGTNIILARIHDRLIEKWGF